MRIRKLTKNQIALISIIIETGLWVAYLILVCTGLALSSAQQVAAPEALLGSSFLVYAFIYLHRVAFRRDEYKMLIITDLVSAVIFLGVGIILFVIPTSTTLVLVVTYAFFTTLALRRIPRLVIWHKLRNILVNLMVWAVLAILILSTHEETTWSALCLAGMVMSIIAVVAMAFSRIRLGVLLRIMRKTYVGEIFFGLVTLIAVFSYVFFMLEPTTFKSYGDALWYSFAIVTTIGFGDFTVVSLVPRILSVILGLYGIVVVAAITSVIVNFYMESSRENRAKAVLEEQENMQRQVFGETSRAENEKQKAEKAEKAEKSAKGSKSKKPKKADEGESE